MTDRKKKIWEVERKGLTNRDEFAIMAELLNGTGVRRWGAEKISEEIEKRLDKRARV